MTTPPNDLPRYRLLFGNGFGDEAFYREVSEALGIGFQLHGSPCVVFNSGELILAQALVWPGDATTPAQVMPDQSMGSIMTLNRGQ